jgi:hypothetical protein
VNGERPGERVVVALREALARNRACIEAVDAASERLREESARVDDRACEQLDRLVAADAQHDAVARHRRAFDRRAHDERSARAFEVAEVGEHQRMAVDDPGDRREQRGFGIERRLERACLRAAQPAQSFDAVGERARFDRPKRLDLRGARGDDELAAAPVADAVRFAVRIEQPPPRDAQRRLQRAGRVVEAGVDDLAVARARAVADAVGRLDDDRLAPRERERARTGEADGAGADDDGIDALHRVSVRPAA